MSVAESDGACSICMEPFTQQGKHRVVSLRCGHIFGRHCITRWIDTKAACPTCSAKVRKADVRNLYAVNVTVVDDARREELAAELHSTKRELNALASRYELLRAKYETLKRRKLSAHEHTQVLVPEATVVLPYGGGRVLVHAVHDCSLLMSAGARIGRMSLLAGANRETVRWFTPGHTAEVRAISVQRHDVLVASTSVRDVFVWNVDSGNVVHHVARGASAVEWDADCPFLLHLAQRNRVVTLDLRAPRDAELAVRLTSPFPQPIHSLVQRPPAALLAGSLGGLCDDTGTALLSAPLYCVAMDDATQRIVCSHRFEGRAATHAVLDASSLAPVLAPVEAAWPNSMLSRTCACDGVLVVCDGNTVRAWDLNRDAAALAELQCSLDGPVLDARVFRSGDGTTLWMAATTAASVRVWRVAEEYLQRGSQKDTL